MRRDVAHAQQHAGHKRGPVEGVVPEGQLLPRSAQQDFLVRHQAAEPDAVDADAVDVAAARPGAAQLVVASGLAGRPAAARSAEISCAVRTAVPDGASTLSGWCSSMISTDSKYREALAAKAEARTEPSAKFGAIRTPTPGWPARSSWSRPSLLRIPAGGAHNGVHAVFDGEADVRLGALGDRQVHHDPGSGVDEGVQGIVPAQRGDKLQVRGGLDGLHGFGAHAPVRAQHGDCELFGHAINPTAGAGAL